MVIYSGAGNPNAVDYDSSGATSFSHGTDTDTYRYGRFESAERII